MRNKIFFVLFLIFISGNFHFSYGQSKMHELHVIKKTLFSSIPKFKGKNIDLTFSIYAENNLKMIVGFNGKKSSEIPVIDLSYVSLTNLLKDSLLMNFDLPKDTTLDINDLLEVSSLRNIENIILEANIFIGTLNNRMSDSLSSIFSMNSRIPLYFKIVKDSFELSKCKFYKSYIKKTIDTFNFKGIDSLILLKGLIKDSLLIGEKISDSLRSKLQALKDLISLKVNSNFPLNNKNPQDIQRLTHTLDSLHDSSNVCLIGLNNQNDLNYYIWGDSIRKIDKLILNGLSNFKSPSQQQTAKGENLNEEFGSIFIDSAQLIVKNGFINYINLWFADSIIISSNNSFDTTTLAVLKLPRMLVLNLSIDIRSVSFTETILSKKYYFLNNEVKCSDIQFTINLGDVFRINHPKNSLISDVFVSESGKLFFDNNHKTIMVKETNINSVFQLNTFSDLAGLQETSPNGLVQIEALFHADFLKIHRSKRFNLNKFYYFDDLEANVKLSKIDNKLKYFDVSNNKTLRNNEGNDSANYIANLQLLQFANLEVGTHFSLIKSISYRKTFNLYAGLGIIRTGIRDSVANGNVININNYNVLSRKFELGIRERIRVTSYIGIDLTVCFISLGLLDNELKQSGGKFFRTTSLNEYKDHDFWNNLIFNPQIQLYYNPNKDESKRLYFRTSLFVDNGAKGNIFFSFQVGYSAEIKNILNFK